MLSWMQTPVPIIVCSGVLAPFNNTNHIYEAWIRGGRWGWCFRRIDREIQWHSCHTFRLGQQAHLVHTTPLYETLCLCRREMGRVLLSPSQEQQQQATKKKQKTFGEIRSHWLGQMLLNASPLYIHKSARICFICRCRIASPAFVCMTMLLSCVVVRKCETVR